MTYDAEISRTNPSCFLFLIDQSGSMADMMPENERSKAEFLADAINRALQELVIKCSKGEGVRDYFSVGVIGYGGQVGPAFSGAVAGSQLSWISEIAHNPARIEERAKKVDDGAGGLLEQSVKFPIWFEPVAQGGTPMSQALDMAHGIISGWIEEHPNSFPPVVMQFTDGEATDGDPAGPMDRLTELASSDGNVILFNVHISSTDAVPISFPESIEDLPDAYAQTMFSGASILTPAMRALASQATNKSLSDNARAFILNADSTLVVEAIDIGTRPGNLR